MSPRDAINRRQFLEKSTLLAAMASGLTPETASAQINSAAGLNVKPVRLGFIGVGIRGTLLMEAAKGIHGVEIVAAADCYKGHLDRAHELISPSIETTGDYRQVLARPDIDAIVVATPDHWHLKMTQEALAAGKHVYVEKPMTHSWEEGEALVEAAEKSGRVVQVGSQYMSMGCARTASELIQGGRLGQLTLVEGRFHRNSATGAWYYPIPPDASPATVNWPAFLGPAPAREFDLRRFFQWRLFWDYSGGLPTDLFVHLVTAVHQLTGAREPESVVSVGGIYHWKDYREVPDQMTAIVTYPQGFVLRLTSTSSNGHPAPMLTFYGSEGTIDYSGTSFTHYYEPRGESFEYSTHSWPDATTARFKTLMRLDENQRPLDGPLSAGPVEYKASNDEDSTRAHVRNWVEAIRSGGKPIEDAATGHRAALVGHMCNLSYRAGKTVRWNARTRRVEV